MVASSSKALAVTMAKAEGERLQFEKGRSVRDLGVDSAGGRKGRRTSTQKQRGANMARRSRRFKKVTTWNSKARTVEYQCFAHREPRNLCHGWRQAS